jgi:E3 ubiquitin-protein ligase SHPRH
LDYLTHILKPATLFDKLERDLALIRRAFNQRVLYFRQLQEISDSVGDAEWDQPTIEIALQDCVTEKTGLELKINTTRARQRYLENLAYGKNDEDNDDDQTCILCRCDFVRGFITHWYVGSMISVFLVMKIIFSAHVFCEVGSFFDALVFDNKVEQACMKAWLSKDSNKTCPVCRCGMVIFSKQCLS